MSVIKIVVDDKTIQEYKKFYFKLNPRARKFPDYISNKAISWNFFLSKTRLSQNSIKQKYSKFIEYLTKKQKIENLNLKKAKVTYNFYFKDNRRRDIDNYTLMSKICNDAFTTLNVWIDDNYKVVELFFPTFEIDKENPRYEISIEYNESDIEEKEIL